MECSPNIIAFSDGLSVDDLGLEVHDMFAVLKRMRPGTAHARGGFPLTFILFPSIVLTMVVIFMAVQVLQIALAWTASLAHIAYLPQIARIGKRIDRDAPCGHARIIEEVRA